MSRCYAGCQGECRCYPDPDTYTTELLREKPSDEQILAAVRRWGNDTMTYVVCKVLRSRGHHADTAWVRRQLKRLEREGHVKRTSTSYAAQLCWSATTPSEITS